MLANWKTAYKEAMVAHEKEKNEAEIIKIVSDDVVAYKEDKCPVFQ